MSAVTPVGNTIRAKTFIHTWESRLYSLIRALYIDGTHTVTTYTHQYNFIGGSNLIPRFTPPNDVLLFLMFLAISFYFTAK